MSDSEEAVQRNLEGWLELQGLTSWAFARPRAHRALGGILPTGWPDLLIVMKGWRRNEESPLLAVEVKAEKGRQDADQKAFQSLWEGAGMVYVVARGHHAVEDVKAVLKAAGVPLKEMTVW